MTQENRIRLSYTRHMHLYNDHLTHYYRTAHHEAHAITTIAMALVFALREVKHTLHSHHAADEHGEAHGSSPASSHEVTGHGVTKSQCPMMSKSLRVFGLFLLAM